LQFKQHYLFIGICIYIYLISALLLVSAIVVALPLGPYTLPKQHKIDEQLDYGGSTITDWPLHLSEEPLQESHHISSAYNTDLWMGTRDLRQPSTASSNTVWPTVSVPGIPEKETIDPSSKALPKHSISTYLQSETGQIGLSGGVRPFLFYTSGPPDSSAVNESHVLLHPTVTGERMFSQVSGAGRSQFSDIHVVRKQNVVSVREESVPVVKSALISEIRSENQNLSVTEGTTVSVNGVQKISPAEDNNNNNNAVVMPKDMNTTQAVFSNSDGILSDNSNFSLEPIVDNLNSFSKGVDKPIVSIPRLVTRDLGNNSKMSLSTSMHISVLASHALDQEYSDHSSSLSTSLAHLKLPASRVGKSAGYFPSQFHPLVLSTMAPSTDGPNVFPVPHSSDTSDIVQSYVEGPKNNDDILNPKHVEAAFEDLDLPEHERNDSKVIWISRTSPFSGITPEDKKLVSATDPESSNFGISQLDDIEMADSPYRSPESSTIAGSRPRIVGDSVSKLPPEFSLPIDKSVDGTDKPSDVDHLPPSPRDKGLGKEMLKVIPPLMASSKVVNNSFQTVRQSDDRTKSSYIPSVDSENTDGNTSVGSVTNDTDFSMVANEAGSLPEDTRSGVLAVPTSVPGLEKVDNVITVDKYVEENKTTVVTILSTILPVSSGRVAAAASTPNGSQHGLNAASITGISLGILVFAALVGKLY
jgi:hypothetical protein